MPYLFQKRREADRKRYAVNRETLISRQRKYVDADRAEIYGRNRGNAARNRAKIRAKQHDTYVRNLEATRERDRERGPQRYSKDPKAHNEYMKKWAYGQPGTREGLRPTRRSPPSRCGRWRIHP